MKNIPNFDEYLTETRKIIDELMSDGSDPDAIYLIEHHVAHYDFDKLEKIVVDAYKVDFDVEDAIEFEDENGRKLFSVDVLCESKLTEEEIAAQQKILFPLIDKHGGIYDGWGTYFEDPNQTVEEYDDQLYFDEVDDEFDFDEFEVEKPKTSRKH